MSGTVNIRQVKNYIQRLDTITDDFKKLLDNDREDALEIMVKKLKQLIGTMYRNFGPYLLEIV